MHPKQIVTLLVVLALASLAAPTAPAHAGGLVTVCDEAHLLAALAGGGAVTFGCSGTITLTATITIAADTTIDGSGRTITISGNNAVRVFVVNSGATLNLNRLTVANGNASGDSGGGIYNNGTLIVSNSSFSGNSAGQHGGGIANTGTLTVNSSTFSGNSATTEGGGGISNGATLTVSGSTFSNNSAKYGGGIASGATLDVRNSTFSGNSGGISGGIYTYVRTLTVSNSTFSGNTGGISISSGALSVSNSTFSGNNVGISNLGAAVTLMNTIVANSTTGGNCYGGTITNGGGNLSYPDVTCPGINGDPKLGPLQNNGGLTRTMALSPGSAAIDAANDAICAAEPISNRDQRGIIRPQGPHCDIGAFEATATELQTHTPTVTATHTRTRTPTATPTQTLSPTPTSTPAETPTPTPTSTPTEPPTSTPTSTPTETPTNTSTWTPTPTSTPTSTPTATPATGDIAGRVWLDADGDRVQGAGEPGVADVNINLSRAGLHVGQATTGGDGAFRVAGLLPGVYMVAEVQPPWPRWSTTPDEVAVDVFTGQEATVSFGDWNGRPRYLPLILRK